MKILQMSDAFRRLTDAYELLDDFLWFISPHLWTSLAADAGVTAPAYKTGEPGGAVTMVSGTTDNNEVAIFSTNAMFKMADDKPIVFEARIQFSEANTNAANVFAGLTSLAAADQLGDNGAGPASGTSQSTIGIYKVDGETVWRTVSQKATTQTATKSTTTAGGASYQVLRVECQPVDATNCEVTYYVDGVALRDTNGVVIKDTVAYSSAAAMKAGVYLKCGSTSSETLNADYVYAGSLR